MGMVLVLDFGKGKSYNFLSINLEYMYCYFNIVCIYIVIVWKFVMRSLLGCMILVYWIIDI